MAKPSTVNWPPTRQTQTRAAALSTILFVAVFAGHALAEECFCLLHVATGAVLRGCEAFKAEKDLYPTAYCTDPQTGVKSEQKITSDWQRIAAYTDGCDPCRPPLPPNANEVPRESPNPSPPTASSPQPIITASRIFAGPNQYPPKEFAAYGILAFRSRPSPYDFVRYLMICEVYVATLPHASELAIPRAKQMVTVWPLNKDYSANLLNRSRDHGCP